MIGERKILLPGNFFNKSGIKEMYCRIAGQENKFAIAVSLV